MEQKELSLNIDMLDCINTCTCVILCIYYLHCMHSILVCSDGRDFQGGRGGGGEGGGANKTLMH